MWIFLIAAALAFGQSYDLSASDLTGAARQLEAVRGKAAAGLVPASAVADAEQAVADAADGAILDRTLYGHLKIEDLTEAQANAMAGAARRRAERVRQKIDPLRKMVGAGIASRARLAALEATLSDREQALDQARRRAALVMQIVALAQSEADPAGQTSAASELAGRTPASSDVEERVDGDHMIEPDEIRDLTLAFEKQFREPFPVSARGQTAVHRALGFDHTGRIDVAVAPDSPEGIWLRKYLEERSIPYYAFRAAIPGKATAPHIHIGPASARLHITD